MSKVNVGMYGVLSESGRDFVLNDTSERLWHDRGAEGDAFARRLRLALRAVAADTGKAIAVYDSREDSGPLDIVEPGQRE